MGGRRWWACHVVLVPVGWLRSGGRMMWGLWWRLRVVVLALGWFLNRCLFRVLCGWMVVKVLGMLLRLGGLVRRRFGVGWVVIVFLRVWVVLRLGLLWGGCFRGLLGKRLVGRRGCPLVCGGLGFRAAMWSGCSLG